jgi:Ohr subfamily peroxiredoxin
VPDHQTDEESRVADRIYTAQATAEGMREGRVSSSDGRVDVQLSRPGAAGDGTNPEQLFAAGYAACFHSAMRVPLARLGLRPNDLEGSTVTAQVHLVRAEHAVFDIAVELWGHLPALEEDKAEQLMAAAHEACPYSRATRGNVDVALHVGEPPA